MTRVALLLITHNRLEYTKRCLFNLFRSEHPYDLTIVDNVSTDGTRKYLTKMRRPNVKIEHTNFHEGLSTITNRFWRRSMAYDLVGKVDNDTLVSPQWLGRVVAIQKASEKVGAIGGFSFQLYEDWDFKHSKQNVRRVGNKLFLAQPSIGGCSYVVKPRLLREVGFMEENICVRKSGESIPGIIYGWSEWLSKARNQHGYIHGYPFPLEIVEHMDDPKSPLCLLDKDRSATELAKKNAQQRGMQYSRDNISRWIRNDGKFLFSQWVYKGNVGERVYD